MIIVKKFLPIALAFSLILNLSAQEEPVLLNEPTQLTGSESVIFDENLGNEAVKNGLVAKLKKHRRAILIGLGCVAVVSAAGAVVYRGELSEFFQKYVLGKKSDSHVGDKPLSNNDSGEKKESDQGQILDLKEVVKEDHNTNIHQEDLLKPQLREEDNNNNHQEPPTDLNDVQNQNSVAEGQDPQASESKNIFDVDDIENVIGDFFQKDEDEYEVVNKNIAEQTKQAMEMLAEALNQASKKTKPVLSPPSFHSGFSQTIQPLE